MQERAGLSKTAEAYLFGKVGEGFQLRSERVVKDGRVGDQISGPYLAKAVAGESGTGFKMVDCYFSPGSKKTPEPSMRVNVFS